MCGICCQSFIKNKKRESARRAEVRAEDSLRSHWAILPLSCVNHNPEALQQNAPKRQRNATSHKWQLCLQVWLNSICLADFNWLKYFVFKSRTHAPFYCHYFLFCDRLPLRCSNWAIILFTCTDLNFAPFHPVSLPTTRITSFPCFSRIYREWLTVIWEIIAD